MAFPPTDVEGLPGQTGLHECKRGICKVIHMNRLPPIPAISDDRNDAPPNEIRKRMKALRMPRRMPDESRPVRCRGPKDRMGKTGIPQARLIFLPRAAIRCRAFPMHHGGGQVEHRQSQRQHRVHHRPIHRRRGCSLDLRCEVEDRVCPERGQTADVPRATQVGANRLHTREPQWRAVVDGEHGGAVQREDRSTLRRSWNHR